MTLQGAHTSPMGPSMEGASLLEQLREDLGFRRIKQGIGRLERIRPMIENMEPAARAVSSGGPPPPSASRLPPTPHGGGRARHVGGRLRSGIGPLPPGAILRA